MQDNDRNFDLMVRSLMSRAEEEVPPQAWDRIASRLDGAVRPAVVFWRRPAFVGGLGVAVAAALVGLGVFLFTARDRSVSLPDNAVAALSVPSGAERMLLSGELPSPQPVADLPYRPSAVPSASMALRQAAPVQDAVPEDGVLPETVSEPAPVEAEMADQTPVEEVFTEDAVTESPETAVSATPTPETVRAGSGREDPFARAAREESRKARPQGVALTFGGNVMTNGSPQAQPVGIRRVSSSVSPTGTYVSQISQESSYSVPLTLGVGARIPLTPKWSVGSGITWSMLERTFIGTYNEVGDTPRTVTGDIHNTLHYVGIPLNIYYDVLRGGRVDFYAFAGATVEKAVGNLYQIPDGAQTIRFRQDVAGVQWSAAIGCGVQFHIVPLVSLYFDPSLRYWFRCDQPTSIRTQQPLSMGLEAGVRFNF